MFYLSPYEESFQPGNAFFLCFWCDFLFCFGFFVCLFFGFSFLTSENCCSFSVSFLVKNYPQFSQYLSILATILAMSSYFAHWEEGILSDYFFNIRRKAVYGRNVWCCLDTYTKYSRCSVCFNSSFDTVLYCVPSYFMQK